VRTSKSFVIPVAAAMLVAVAGCGGKGEPAATAGGGPAATTAAPTPATSTAAAGNRFGTFVAFDDDTSTATVYSYRHNATQFGTPSDRAYVYGALDIKYCLKKVPKGYSGVTIGSRAWRLKFGDDLFKSAGKNGGAALKPEYPEGRRRSRPAPVGAAGWNSRCPGTAV
jgi:hypothetical protein